MHVSYKLERDVIFIGYNGSKTTSSQCLSNLLSFFGRDSEQLLRHCDVIIREVVKLRRSPPVYHVGRVLLRRSIIDMLRIGALWIVAMVKGVIFRPMTVMNKVRQARSRCLLALDVDTPVTVNRFGPVPFPTIIRILALLNSRPE